MAKQLIPYNGRSYRFNSEAFRVKLMPENCTENLKERINRMIEQENMTVTFETVKAWYYKNNSTTDIDNLEKAAHFLNAEVTDFLTETDEVWECIQEANKYSEERTVIASLVNIKHWLMTAPINTPDFIPRKGIVGIIDRYPKGLFMIIIFNIMMCFTIEVMDIEAMAAISPFMLLLLIEWCRFWELSYFKNNTVWKRICNILIRVFEAVLIITIIIRIIK